MNMAYREKSLWLVGFSLVLVFGLYFWWVVPGHAADVRPTEVRLFVVAVVLLVALQGVGHTLLAVLDRRAEPDERDRLIGLIGERNGSFVLAVGVSLSLFVAVVTRGNFVFTHTLLAFWVLASVVSVGTALWLYRRGA